MVYGNGGLRFGMRVREPRPADAPVLTMDTLFLHV